MIDQPFATHAQVEGTWSVLDAAQREYADLLLRAAAFWIRSKVASIADDNAAAQVVSIEVVRAALQRDLFGGAESGTQTRGGKTDTWSRARTATVAELADTLVFSDFHRQLLGLAPATGAVYRMGDRTPDPDPITVQRGWPC